MWKVWMRGNNSANERWNWVGLSLFELSPGLIADGCACLGGLRSKVTVVVLLRSFIVGWMGVQKGTCRSHFSPSSMWVPGWTQASRLSSEHRNPLSHLTSPQNHEFCTYMFLWCFYMRKATRFGGWMALVEIWQAIFCQSLANLNSWQAETDCSLWLIAW